MKPEATQTTENSLIKTRRQGKRTIKTTARNTQKAVKSTAKGTVKASEKGIKTAQATSKAAIKTTEQTVKTTQAAAKASVKTVSEKWCISERQMQKLGEENHIDSIEKFGRTWMIPKDAEKPADGQLKTSKVDK